MKVDEYFEFKGNKFSIRIWLIVFVVIVFIVFIVGIVLIVFVVKKEGDNLKYLNLDDIVFFCEYFEEVKWIGLDEIILNVKKIYYEKMFFWLLGDLDVICEDILKNYKVYNLMLDYIKGVIDVVRDFFKDVNKIKVNLNKFKLRECKVLL